MGPAVGGVRTEVGTARGGVWSVVGCWWCDGGIGRRGMCWFGWLDGGGCVDTMVASTASSSGAVPAVLISVAKVSAEKEEGFGGIVFSTPFATCDFEETGGVDYVVSDTDDGGIAGGIVASCGETNAGVELSEESFNGRWRVPRCMHAELVGIQFVLRDLAMVGPKMGEDGEAGHVTVAEGGVIEVLNVVIGNCGDDLGAEGLVDFVVGAKDGAGASVDAVEFGDLMGREAGRVFADGRGVDGGNERYGGEDGIVGDGESEANVTVEAIAAVRGDRGGVGVKLGLSGA